jgi:hypothetical protein
MQTLIRFEDMPFGFAINCDVQQHDGLGNIVADAAIAFA